MRDDRERLRDIFEGIARIERHVSGGQPAFHRDELIQTWVVHHIEIIGEAARGLSQPFRDAHPGVPWRRIIGMRNILIHSYYQIDLALTWSVVERDLTSLKAAVAAMLRELDEPSG